MNIAATISFVFMWPHQETLGVSFPFKRRVIGRVTRKRKQHAHDRDPLERKKERKPLEVS